MGLSFWHLVVLLIVVVLVFGTKRLRNAGKDLGEAVKGFKEGMKEGGADASAPASSDAAAPQVTTNDTAHGETIDVEAKEKR